MAALDETLGFAAEGDTDVSFSRDWRSCRDLAPLMEKGQGNSDVAELLQEGSTSCTATRVMCTSSSACGGRAARAAATILREARAVANHVVCTWTAWRTLRCLGVPRRARARFSRGRS